MTTALNKNRFDIFAPQKIIRNAINPLSAHLDKDKLPHQLGEIQAHTTREMVKAAPKAYGRFILGQARIFLTVSEQFVRGPLSFLVHIESKGLGTQCLLIAGRIRTWHLMIHKSLRFNSLKLIRRLAYSRFIILVLI
jgi:hypothetical protein